jgi:hypothetical protein
LEINFILAIYRGAALSMAAMLYAASGWAIDAIKAELRVSTIGVPVCAWRGDY